MILPGFGDHAGIRSAYQSQDYPRKSYFFAFPGNLTDRDQTIFLVAGNQVLQALILYN